MICQVCGNPIKGEPANLSNLSNPPRILRVCETCAGSEWVNVTHDGIQVTVHRDDYLQADKERFQAAVESAWAVLEDHGWSLEGLKLSGKSDLVKEPLD